MSEIKGYISELFQSFEGEGKHQGELSFFLRMSGCNLNCKGCDTPKSITKEKKFSFLGKEYQNPITSDELIKMFNKIFVDTKQLFPLSITGGEPLVQADFLNNFLNKLNYPGLITLETNGTLPEEYEKIKKYINFISMDWKLEGTYNFKNLHTQNISELHKKFLNATKGKKTQVKLVVSDNTLAEFEHSIYSIFKTRKGVSIIIQPYEYEPGKFFNDFDLLKEYYIIAKKYFSRVWVKSQMHKCLNFK